MVWRSLNIAFATIYSYRVTPFLADYMDPIILHDKYHGRWCPGSLRRQDISSHDIELVLPEYSGLNTWGPSH